MEKLNSLIIVDKDDVQFLDVSKTSERWNLHWMIIDYDQLHKEVEKIRKTVIENEIDFVLYSRNDQVAKRISIGPVHKRLAIGYSSFSGIDDEMRVEQMTVCFSDFLKTGVNLDFHSNKTLELSKYRSGRVDGTYSVIFDTEQLGGVRFGLPRILNLLDSTGVKAVFFLTNIMKVVYPNILDVISSKGHEIGIHGKYHEFLSNYDATKQKIEVMEMVKEFDDYPVKGSNFMGRMNDATISALASNKIDYFVHPLLYNYTPFGFSKLPISPFKFNHNGVNICIIPVTAETYGRPWIMIKGMLDSAISEALKTGFHHITVLCHPFRDGNLKHIHVLKKLLIHLAKNGLRPILLKDLVKEYQTKLSVYVESLDDLNYPRKYSLPKTLRDFSYAPLYGLLGLSRRFIFRNRTIF